MKDLDPEIAAALKQAQAQPDAYASRGPVMQWAGALELNQNKARILAGDGSDVLRAVATCAIHGLAMPDWLAMAFMKRYYAVAVVDSATSWDDPSSFGRAYPKNARLSELRNQRYAPWRVANAVREAIATNPHRTVNIDFWTEVGAAIGMCPTNAQKFHAAAVRTGVTITAGAQKKKFFGKLSPTQFKNK